MAGPDFTIYSWLSQRVDASNRPTSHYAEPCYSTVARPQKMYGREDHQQSESETGFYHWRFRSRGVFCLSAGSTGFGAWLTVLMIGFASRHWKGEYAVLRSLFVNTLAPNALLLALQGRFDLTRLIADPALGKLVLVLTASLWLILLVWQFTGCFRSASLRISYSGSAMNLYVVFFGLLITVIPVMGGMLSLSDQYNRAQQGAVLSAESSGKSYTLTLLNNEMLAFTGDINFGATRDFVSILAAHPNIQTVLLESDGGVIVEARGMANTILDNGLNTRVESDCYSACTLVFISGRVRSLGDKAALGFHQYLLETPYYYPWVDPVSEAIKDKQRFARQNVTPTFLNKMYLYDHESLWIPSHAELAQAGVTTSEK